ncbi:helicase with zinc finger domain 2-like [Solea solea]|uniref:helicase with zinc finger domain 2-like n=1 Tax=Solea solea TaxID=90069 RepID=UPI00272C1ADD|nr:helicase with zinc finger domain 2-like [Solea solea]
MSASASRLAPLLSTHDIKLACTQCSVKEKEVTYTIKSVQHRCACDILLCKAKGRSKWRPVSRRPTYPNPSQYFLCYYFVEDYGCTAHQQCTFARSEEEAVVWTFEKNHRLDHTLFCSLVAQSKTTSDEPNDSKPPGDLLLQLDLETVCDLCSVEDNEITYSVKSLYHECSSNLLLAKAKTSDQWRPVSERPTQGIFGRYVLYKVCNFFVEGSGCTLHGNECTYARSNEEATVWNYIRDNKMDCDELIRLVNEAKSLSSTPQSEAEYLLQQFSGRFVEICKDCFHRRPQKLSTKRWSATCTADEAHNWDPVLVYHHSGNIYSQIRPLPNDYQFKYCSHVTPGKPCRHEVGHCKSAQSEVEMAVWKAEHDGFLVRPHLLELTQPEQTELRQVTMYCKICRLVLSTPESFYKHCSSLEHARLLSEDTTTKWRRRPPPHNRRAEFWLCERPQACRFGIGCQKAHSVEELQEWMMRAPEEKDIKLNTEDQSPMSYNEKLLEEYRNSSNEVYIMSEEVDDVIISCDEDLTVACEQSNATLKWHFQVETERQLVHVALLKQEPGALFTLGDISSEACVYSSGKCFFSGDIMYDITVSFSSINPGFYEQWLVLDFDMRPVLLKKLRIRLGQPVLDDSEQTTVNHEAITQSVERWHRGNRVFIPCSSRTEEKEELLKQYKPPQMNFAYKYSHNNSTPLTKENYKDRMHQFLYNEEHAEDQVLSRLNVCGEITTLETLSTTQFGMKEAPPGELFCVFSVPCNLTQDTPEGLVLRRSIQSGLIAPLTASGQNKVYEAIFLRDQTTENKLNLQLSKKCCADLALKSNEAYQMEVQFQLDRHHFCTMHKAIDLLPDTNRVLPDLKSCAVPVNNIQFENLNAKQQSAIDFITGNSNVQNFVAPLLVYGPFGTGKTFTLATAARELSKRPHNKVLICTHTNSSADLYIRDHLHPFIDEKNDWIKPIRIKANKNMKATDKITLKYCLLSEDGKSFLPPTKAALDRHKIVITTTSMAKRFHDLKLSEGYFTHIFIDEASQMLECEALIALGLAGPNTRVVLAGDHMQMTPKLFSVDDHHRSNHTLLYRLFHYYQGQKCDAAQKSRIIFNENYRSTKEIVEFVSNHFYVGKNDVIKATGNVPAPADGHALRFHHVRGECLLDTASMTWYNIEEVVKVTEAVIDIFKHWPSTWGYKEQSSICVVSEGIQVRKIRKALSERGLGRVHVENLANVQGKQFRAIVMTAVQTRDSLQTSHLPGLELFNDAHVLNTAMTRAQSQVVVVGDAAALCCFGKCSAVWRSYLHHCIDKKSVTPQHFTKDFFEEDVKETVRFQRCEPEEESNTFSDAILQELKDEYEQLATQYSSEDDSLDFEDFNHYDSRSTNIKIHTDQSELFEKPMGMYEQERSHNRYFGKQPDYPTSTSTREWENEKPEAPLVCLFEDVDHFKQPLSDDKHIKRMMIPISRSHPKIRILISKRTRNLLPLWKKIHRYWKIVGYERFDEKLRQNNVFMVQVIKRREDCTFPLGNIVEILPVGSSLEAGLTILNAEFTVASKPKSYEVFSRIDEEEALRVNMTEVTTFTVDKETAQLLDDAISVRDTGDQFELGVHISDVASYVRPGGKIDQDAKHQGATYYHKNEYEAIHMIHKDLCTDYFSLQQDKDRRVVSLIFKMDKKTNEITEGPKLQLSQINSNKKLSYEDAEKMINENYGRRPNFDTTRVEDCVKVAYCFAKAQRKTRLVDWAYCEPKKNRLPGNRKAHLMIEELNVLFNTKASEILIRRKTTSDCTPLRCQDGPSSEKITEFKNTWNEVIPLSFHVRHRVEHDTQASKFENFCILTQVWTDIQSAARANDIDKMVDLVAADDMHPLLQPVLDEFRRCCNKAYFICSNPSVKADILHYSLNVPSYTQASAPIRRYTDIVLQRLLHSVIRDGDPQYTRAESTTLCDQMNDKLIKVKAYDQKAEQLKYAVSITKQSVLKTAVVVSADPNTDSFAVSFPCNKDIFPDCLFIMYKDLQLDDQPFFNETHPSIILKWKRRIYTADAMQTQQDFQMLPNCGPCVELPLSVWKATVEAIDEENWDHAMSLITNANAKQLSQSSGETDTCTSKDGKDDNKHYVHFNLHLQPRDTFQIQMTSEIKRGYQMPTVQLVHIKPNFEICVDHVHNPVKCFYRSADSPAKLEYVDTDKYIDIWKPLCEMESATTAVGESDSIVIENLVVNFRQEQGGRLTGSFVLPQEWIDEWAIECNLSKCLLCIRKRGLPASTLEHYSVMDPREFTWVAHCVTSKVEKQINFTKEQHKVEFYANHQPMETPKCVHEKNTAFTVEIIPKLLPDSRTENAVVTIPSACDLVKRIALGQALGHLIPKDSKRHIIREQLPNGFPDLNNCQYVAVDKALNNVFTLIQGPPGTGKSIVGVYLLYCFWKLNILNPRKFDDENKKQVILYCGPSNKSVDVVAEYLMKYENSFKFLSEDEEEYQMKSLRVYSQQMEMLDYPYPEGNLQFSQRTRRQEKSNPKIRSIVLHHRMREEQNPYSSQIKSFDQRIDDKEDLTAQEVKEYKKLLRDARTHELERHDIILCTCTQSSAPSLTKTVNARQILIDECAMATEPQALIPLVSNKPEKIVLIGDHKQLRPIVKNFHARQLGMSKSLFERYYTIQEKRTVMLDIQYRMHVDICKFPSEEYYGGKLKTGVKQPSSVLRVDKKAMPIVFGDVRGETVSLFVCTSKGNERSKANLEEREKVISIAEKLVTEAKIKQRSIAILSPYNAQVSQIKDELSRREHMKGITVTTFTKSQGSEWRYVILSTVCSLSSEEIKSRPRDDRTWLSKHVGFVGDANQINVGITRAKEGLCIIGNLEMLMCNKAWKNLLEHYKSHSAVTDADNISVRCAK